MTTNSTIFRIFMPNIRGMLRYLLLRTAPFIDGSIPTSKRKLVEAWIEIHRDDLYADWQLAVKGETVFKIKGLE